MVIKTWQYLLGSILGVVNTADSLDPYMQKPECEGAVCFPAPHEWTNEEWEENLRLGSHGRDEDIIWQHEEKVGGSESARVRKINFIGDKR